MSCLSITELSRAEQAEIELERLLRDRRHAVAARHYASMAREAEQEKTMNDDQRFIDAGVCPYPESSYRYTIFRVLNGKRYECVHVGTLASIPDGWSWTKREREA
jgi:hypothetical protein